MLFKKARKLTMQHILLIGLACAAISLLVIAVMTILPSYLLIFSYNNSLFFLESWLVMTVFVVAIAAQVLVLLGPPVYYVIKKKKVEYGLEILLSTLLMMVVLVLLVVAIAYLGWGETYVYEDYLY